MEEMRFTKKPGEKPTTEADGGFAILDGDPTFVIMPSTLGGKRANVIGRSERRCPKCGHDRSYPLLCRVLHLDNGINVLECPKDGFIWYKA